MKLSKKQKWSIARSTARINLWHGSVRASKTVASLIRFIQAIPVASPDGQIFLIGKTLDALKRNIIVPLQDLLGSDIRYYPGKREVHLWDRVIDTIGANDERAEEKIRGSTVALAYGDEVTLYPENFMRMLDSRLSLEDSIFLGTTNTDSPNHHIKKTYLDRENELDFRSFHFTLDDNIFLSKRYVENIKKNYIGLWYKRFILGLWCVAEGAIYDFFDKELHTLIRAPKADYYDISIDYGTGNPTVFLLIGNSFAKNKPYIWAENEYYYDSKKQQRQKTDSEYSKDLVLFVSGYTNSIDPIVESMYGMERLLQIRSERKIQVPLHNVVVDPSAASLKLQLKRDGFVGVKDANNDVVDGIRLKSTMLKNGDYAICSCCKNYIDEMFGYVWDSKWQDKGIDKPVKTFDHCQDAGRYAVATKFLKGGIDYSNI